MSRNTFISSVTVAIAIAGFATSAFADSGNAQATYRRAVLGESGIAAQSVQLESRVTPGPIASHLIYLGVSPAAAIEQARAAGEQAVETSTASGQTRLSGVDLYSRVVLDGESGSSIGATALR